MKISITECDRAAASEATPAGREKILPADMPRKKRADMSAKAGTTPLERGLAVAQDALKQVPDTRDEIVEEIRKRIENGEYRVSGEEVADMMMRRREADRLR